MTISHKLIRVSSRERDIPAGRGGRYPRKCLDDGSVVAIVILLTTEGDLLKEQICDEEVREGIGL